MYHNIFLTIKTIIYIYIVQAISCSSESEVMLGIVNDTEEKSQKDQVETAS